VFFKVSFLLAEFAAFQGKGIPPLFIVYGIFIIAEKGGFVKYKTAPET
jgi:hypothetical protein